MQHFMTILDVALPLVCSFILTAVAGELLIPALRRLRRGSPSRRSAPRGT